MIPASLSRLEACQEALIAALDADDLDRLEPAILAFRDAVEEVRAQGGWRDNPEVAGTAAHIKALAEAARVRVNFLTDLNQRRIEAFAAARGRSVATTYGARGQMSAA